GINSDGSGLGTRADGRGHDAAAAEHGVEGAAREQAAVFQYLDPRPGTRRRPALRCPGRGAPAPIPVSDPTRSPQPREECHDSSPVEAGPRYNETVIAPGAQPERLGDAGPVRPLLGG